MNQRLQSLNQYLWNTGNTISEMRLLIEGAIVLFEGDALPLTKLANSNREYQAAAAFDTVGAALYNLRERIREMQQYHIAEVNRQCESEDSEHLQASFGALFCIGHHTINRALATLGDWHNRSR